MKKFMLLIALSFVMMGNVCGGGGGGGDGDDVQETPAPIISKVELFKILSNGIPFMTDRFCIGDEANMEITASDEDQNMSSIFIDQFLLPDLLNPHLPTSQVSLPPQVAQTMKYWFLENLIVAGPAGDWRVCFWIVDSAGNESLEVCRDALIEDCGQDDNINMPLSMSGNTSIFGVLGDIAGN